MEVKAAKDADKQKNKDAAKAASVRAKTAKLLRDTIRKEEEVDYAQRLAKGEQVATALSGAFETFFANMAAGTMTLGQAFDELAKGIFKAMVSAIGSSLMSEGAGYIARGVAALLGITTAAMAPGLMAGGAQLLVAGAAIKGASLLLAEGGLVTQPTQAIIGEAGPELVIPLDQLNERGFAGPSGPVTVESVNIELPNVLTTSPEEAEEFGLTGALELATGLQQVRNREGKRA
jgi:hypothetical protein